MKFFAKFEFGGGATGVADALLGIKKCNAKLGKTSYNLDIMNYSLNSKKGFTLAEVLITLAIIGVVAALTIPTLVLQNQQKGWDTAATVFERKLGEAIRVMNIQQTLNGYKTTEDFVNELTKHLKVIKTCKNDNLMSCFEEKVYWGTDSEEVDMTKINKAKNFGQDDWETELIGIQLANGTSALISYNPACNANPYDANAINIAGNVSNKSGYVKIGTNCVAVLYDTSGNAKPNSQGKDLRGINVNKLGGMDCASEYGGKCWSAVSYPEPLSIEECKKADLGDYSCNIDGDYAAGALLDCKRQGKTLATAEQVKDLLKNYIGIDSAFNEAHATEFNYTPGRFLRVAPCNNGDCVSYDDLDNKVDGYVPYFSRRSHFCVE